MYHTGPELWSGAAEKRAGIWAGQEVGRRKWVSSGLNVVGFEILVRHWRQGAQHVTGIDVPAQGVGWWPKCESLAYGQSSVLCDNTVIVGFGNLCGLKMPIPLKVCSHELTLWSLGVQICNTWDFVSENSLAKAKGPQLLIPLNYLTKSTLVVHSF